LWAMRRMEARGTIRGGRFVNGFAGEQYALPEAIEVLRSVRKSDRKGETIRISGADPLNLVGIVLPGPRVPAVPTNSITYVDGVPAPAEAAASDEPAGCALSGQACTGRCLARARWFTREAKDL